MMALATALAALLTTSGLFLTWWLSAALGVEVPTGPVIIVLATLLYAASSLSRVLLRRTAQTAGEAV